MEVLHLQNIVRIAFDFGSGLDGEMLFTQEVDSDLVYRNDINTGLCVNICQTLHLTQRHIDDIFFTHDSVLQPLCQRDLGVHNVDGGIIHEVFCHHVGDLGVVAQSVFIKQFFCGLR